MSIVLFTHLADAPVIAPPSATPPDPQLAFQREVVIRSINNPVDMGYSEADQLTLIRAREVIMRRTTTGNLNNSKSTWFHRALSQ